MSFIFNGENFLARQGFFGRPYPELIPVQPEWSQRLHQPRAPLAQLYPPPPQEYWNPTDSAFEIHIPQTTDYSGRLPAGRSEPARFVEILTPPPPMPALPPPQVQPMLALPPPQVQPPQQQAAIPPMQQHSTVAPPMQQHNTVAPPMQQHSTVAPPMQQHITEHVVPAMPPQNVKQAVVGPPPPPPGLSLPEAGQQPSAQPEPLALPPPPPLAQQISGQPASRPDFLGMIDQAERNLNQYLEKNTPEKGTTTTPDLFCEEEMASILREIEEQEEQGPSRKRNNNSGLEILV